MNDQLSTGDHDGTPQSSSQAETLRGALQSKIDTSKQSTRPGNVDPLVGGDPHELSGILRQYAQHAAGLGEFELALEFLQTGDWEHAQIGAGDFIRLAAQSARAGRLQFATNIVLDQVKQLLPLDDIPADSSMRNELAHLIAQHLSSIGHILSAMNDYRERTQKTTLSKSEEILRNTASEMLAQLEALRVNNSLPGHDQWAEASENLVAIVSHVHEQFRRASATELAARVANIDPRIRHVANQAIKRIIRY